MKIHVVCLCDPLQPRLYFSGPNAEYTITKIGYQSYKSVYNRSDRIILRHKLVRLFENNRMVLHPYYRLGSYTQVPYGKPIGALQADEVAPRKMAVTCLCKSSTQKPHFPETGNGAIE